MPTPLRFFCILFIFTCANPLFAAAPKTPTKPWLGVHVDAGSKASLDKIRQSIPGLAKIGVNTLILEINYGFEFDSRPEMRNPRGVTKAQAKEVAALGRTHGIRVIPSLNCLGHQSWAKRTGALLTNHPELDETPGKYPENQGIYCRSWCPLHPDTSKIVFPMIDELIDAFSADAFHVGMDEVFIMASDDCPRCKGKDPGELFAKQINDLHEHLVNQRKVEMLMWADRLLDAKSLGYSKWEASTNGTFTAIDEIPRDIILCDWHYEKQAEYKSIPFLLKKGFRLWPAGWHKIDAVTALLDYSLAQNDPKMLGYLSTTWGKAKHEALENFEPTKLAAKKLIGFAATDPATQPTSHSAKSPWQPEKFPISFWCGPPGEFITVERFRQIADAGFTFVMPPCAGTSPEQNHKILDAARAVGLKAFIQDSRMPVSMSGAGAKAGIDALVAEYCGHPALAGYFVADEPGPGTFPSLAEVFSYVRQKDPAHPAYVNLLPNVAPAWAIGPDYEKYVDDYVNIVAPFAISYDHYHFFKKRDGEHFFDNLAIVRRVSLRRHLPFWNIVLAIPHFDYRRPTEAEKRYEAMQTLAYGGKGVLWFTYWQPAADGTWGEAIINADGSPTTQYPEIQRVNHDLQAIGQHLLHATSIAVLPRDKADGSPARIESGNCTLGLFETDRFMYAMLASLDYRQASTVTLQLCAGAKPIEQLDKATGKWQPVETKAAEKGATVNVKLQPGDGELLRWERARP